ncbi:MAG: integrin alpha, partial [Ignavibacteriaceae bacterium]|nr:integrin alpha [Ignavibacteriaceae bacterium]MCW8960520.1 integrin alpha [Ignavibacteriaceae bacterium]
MKKFISFILVVSCVCIAQQSPIQHDSLYLIGTITGQSNEKRIGGTVRIGDVNGDGYGDFVISMRTGNTIRDQGVVKLYLGTADFDLNADVIFHYPGTDSLNDFAGGYGIGDVNDDGYDDFVLVGSFGDWVFPKGKVFLYYGGETIDTIPVNEFYQPNAIQDWFGQTVGVGDIDKDGFDDFAISSPYNWTDGKGYVYLFWGGDTISWERSITFTSNTIEDGYGGSIANIGDVNQDGFDDMAAGAPGGLTGGADTGKVYIYYGGIQMDNIADTILVSANVSDFFGRIIKNAGDLNRDEMIDFCIAWGSYILIYTFRLETPLRINSGYSIDADGDINKDGYDDIIIGDDWKIR